MSLPIVPDARPYVRVVPRGAGDETAPAPPAEVKIRLLQPCDLRCGMCWHWQDPERGKKQLSFEVCERVVAELGAMGVSRLKLTGGEPTLRPDLPRIVAAARAAGLGVTLATNAYGLTPQKAEALVRAGVDSLHVSLDAGVAAVHDEIRGVVGAFEKSTRALAEVKRRHPKVKRKLVTVVQARNIGSLAPLVPLAADVGARELYLLQVHTEAWCNSDRPSRAQYQRFFLDELPTLLEDGVRLGVRVRPSPIFSALLGLSAREQASALRARGAAIRFEAELAAYAEEAYGRSFYAKRPCEEIQSRAEIAETGDVYPCCHTELPELSMGNVHDEAFTTIWARARYRDFRAPEGPLPHHARCLGCKDSHYAPGPSIPAV